MDRSCAARTRSAPHAAREMLTVTTGTGAYHTEQLRIETDPTAVRTLTVCLLSAHT